MHLYAGPLSLFSRKVEIALAEKGLPHSVIMVPFSQTKGYAPKHETVVAFNPKGQVPVLVDGDVTIYDSTVILEYLEDAYPEPALYPSEQRLRARCRLLELEADEVLLAPVRKLMFRTEPPSDPVLRRGQEFAALDAGEAIAGNNASLDAMLDGDDFLCGTFSVADIATFIVVHWSLRLGGPGLSRHVRLGNWYRRLADRPAFVRVVNAIAAADRDLSHPVTMSEV